MAASSIKQRTALSADFGPSTRVRVVVLGAGAVGKTSLVKRFLFDQFDEQHLDTVEDLHSRLFLVNGQKLQLELLDTAGTMSFPAMRRVAVASASAFLLLYAVDDEGSFLFVDELFQEIQQLRRDDWEHLPTVVVANKTDRPSRQVESVRAANWTRQRSGAFIQIGLVETSARLGDGVRHVFDALARQSRLVPDVPPQPPPSPPATTTTTTTATNNNRASNSRIRGSLRRVLLFSRAQSVAAADRQLRRRSPGDDDKVAKGGSVRMRRHKANIGGEGDEQSAVESCIVQ